MKKVAKKSLLNTSKPKGQAEKRVPAIPINISTNWRDEEEERVDYEPEDQPCFSPHEDDVSEPGDSPRTPIPGQADSSSPDYEFGGGAANDAPMAGQKRRSNSPEDELRRKAPKDELAASLRRGGKSIPLFKDDIIVANPPGTAPGGSQPTQDKDELAASLRRGRKPIPLFKDDNIVANPPGTAPEGSQSTQDKDESAASLRRGGKAVIPAEQYEQANLPGPLRGEVSPAMNSMRGGS